MKYKRLFSQLALTILCLGLFSTQTQSMQMPFQGTAGMCVGYCNAWGDKVNKYSCDHAFCEKCDESYFENERQLDNHIKCPVCNTIIESGHQINVGPHTSNMYIINNFALRKALLDNNLKLATYVGAYVGAAYATKRLFDKLPLGVTSCLVGCFSIGTAGLVAYIKSHYLNKAVSEAKNVVNSKILEKRINAFKNEYYKRILISTAATIFAPISLYGIAKTLGWWNRDIEYVMSNVLLASSYFNNLVLDEAASKYENIPKIKIK